MGRCRGLSPRRIEGQPTRRRLKPEVPEVIEALTQIVVGALADAGRL